MSGKKKIAFRGPIHQIVYLMQKSGMGFKTGEQRAVLPPADAAPPAPEYAPAEASDTAVFIEAMTGVAPGRWKSKSHAYSRRIHVPEADPSLLDLQRMREALKRNNPIPIPDHPEYIEGWIGIGGERFLLDLRNGLYSIQGQIDLHGLNQEEARAAVEQYVILMSRFRCCCIKIIHGRGINSPPGHRTLKDGLPRLLSTRRISRYVVAYASAPSHDGGVGSTYVLLRPHPR